LVREPTAKILDALARSSGLSSCGFLLAFSYSDASLAMSGIYAHTRNPLYLGSAILAAGFIIAGHSLWAGLLVGAYFCVFYYAVMRNEEDELREKFGAAFQEYAGSVPLFLPSIFRAAKGPADGQTPKDFSWQQYLRNREYKALIGTVGALAIVWLRMWLRTRYGY
jgi:Phospholipid methyltransferase